MNKGPLDALRETQAPTEFLGYESLSSDSRIVGLLAADQLVDHVREIGHEQPVTVILDRSPFYGEAGGQVGDTGRLTSPACEFEVLDTQRSGGFILHIGHLRHGELALGKAVSAEVNTSRRAGIRRAHSATHLLHHALQSVLGKHATQRGSKVEDDQLRFDFTQPTAVTRDQLRAIEDIVNSRVVEASAVQWTTMDLEEARKLGAMALFGERYPDRVRVVSMGDFSRELCGGTHLSNTGQIGLCRIVGEESVAAGTRRITALTGPRALASIRESEQRLLDIAQLVKSPRADDAPQRVAALIEELKTVKKELQKAQSQSAGSVVDELLNQAIDVGGVLVVTGVGEWNADQIRAHLDELRKRKKSVAALLGSGVEGKVILIAGLTKDLVERGLHAGELVKAAARPLGGGGGGRPDLAQAGGKDPALLPQALHAGLEFLKGKLA